MAVAPDGKAMIDTGAPKGRNQRRKVDVMILCCGEALIDMIPRPAQAAQADAIPHDMIAHIGGAAANTAIALGRQGAPVGIVTGLSSDRHGRQISAALHAASVSTAHAVHSARPTTLAIVQLDNGDATYRFEDENSALRMIRVQDLPDLPDTVSTLLFGGISLCHAPVGDAMVALAERHAGTVPIMLDPNIRPGFAPDEAAYRRRLRRLIACADIVKTSREDLDWLFDDDAPAREKAQRLLDAGVGWVVLTSGGSGASAWHGNGTTASVSPPQVDVVDTVGAGDIFNAGLLARALKMDLLRKPAIAAMSADQLRAIVANGVAAAAISVSRAGADAPWQWELES